MVGVECEREAECDGVGVGTQSVAVRRTLRVARRHHASVQTPARVEKRPKTAMAKRQKNGGGKQQDKRGIGS